jgi:hypothetical protein
MVAIATCDGNVSVFHMTGSRWNDASRLLISPYFSSNALEKIRVTATGVTTYGIRTLMRQNVLALMFWSRTAAISTAPTSCGMAESRKMLTVLKRLFQKKGSFSSAT